MPDQNGNGETSTHHTHYRSPLPLRPRLTVCLTRLIDGDRDVLVKDAKPANHGGTAMLVVIVAYRAAASRCNGQL